MHLQSVKSFGEELSEEDSKTLLSLPGAKQLNYRKGDHVVVQGEIPMNLVKIISGSLFRLFLRNNCAKGKVHVEGNPLAPSENLSSPSYLGEQFIFDRKPSPFSAVAVSDAELYLIPLSSLSQHLR